MKNLPLEIKNAIILRGMLDCSSIRETSELLNCHVKSVEYHRRKFLKKYHCGSARELAKKIKNYKKN